MKKIYLDYAAATPLDDRVLDAMKPYYSEKFYNPSATYLAAKSVKIDVEEARASVAKMLGVRANEIIFTAGGTEANNLAIHGVMRQYPDANVVVSAVEHESVLQAAKIYNYREAPVETSGAIDIEALEGLIDENTVLVSVMYANNEVGTIQPIARIANLITSIRHKRNLEGNKLPIYFHSDACQAANYLNLNNLGTDLMTLNGGKIYGPKQSGALITRSNVNLQPQVLGGGQERGLRSGTENVAQIIGFSKALEIAQDLRTTEAKRLKDLQDYAGQQLMHMIPATRINGTAQRLSEPNESLKDSMKAMKVGNRLPNNLHITFMGQDNERLMMQLDEAGILCATGSACSASNEESSHVLKAMGLSDEEAQSSLRFTMGRNTTKSDIDKTVKVLAQLVG